MPTPEDDYEYDEFEESHSRFSSGSDSARSIKIFVGGLSADTTDAGLRAYFERNIVPMNF